MAPGTPASTTTSAHGGGGSTAHAEVAKFCDAVAGPLCDALFACCTDAQTLQNLGVYAQVKPKTPRSVDKKGAAPNNRRRSGS